MRSNRPHAGTAAISAADGNGFPTCSAIPQYRNNPLLAILGVAMSQLLSPMPPLPHLSGPSAHLPKGERNNVMTGNGQ